MHFYDKRVAFLISDQHFIPHGGIGSFCKSFCEMAEDLNWAVDIVMDKQPRNQTLKDHLTQSDHQIYWPQNPVKDSEHTNTFAFSDGFNFERTLNFRKAIMRMLEHAIPDIIIVNTPEAGYAAYDLNLAKHVPLIYYTHNENFIFLDVKQSKVFNEAFNEIGKRIMTYENVIVGTQTERNAELIKEHYPDADVHSLPMRVPERGLLEVSDSHKKGVIFIGRHEPRKNPSAFVEAVSTAGLSAKVLTNDKGKAKFERDFRAAGVTDYEIRAGIIGQEKVQFIKSARVAYHPSLQESYGFCAMETLHSCPTYALVENEWWRNFDGYIRTTTKKTVVEDLLAAHDEDVNEAKYVQMMAEMDVTIAEQWQHTLQKYIVENAGKSNKKTRLIEELEKANGCISLNDFYFQALKREHLAVDDVESVFNKRGTVCIWHTSGASYVGLTDEFKEVTLNKSTFKELFG